MCQQPFCVGAMVLWLWEETDDQEVVSSNPGTAY